MNLSRLVSALAAFTGDRRGAAYGHAERLTYYPNHKLGTVPKYRSGGKALVVCKKDSGQLIRKLLEGKDERRNLALLEDCR
jgi:hypothetical protein